MERKSMGDVKTMVTEYLSITGRPAATLSVEEYLLFCKQCGEDMSVFPKSSNDDYTTGSALKKEQENFPLPTPTLLKPDKGRIPTAKENASDTMSAFSLMQSIPG